MLHKIVINPEIFNLMSSVFDLQRELDLLWDYIFDSCLVVVPVDNAWFSCVANAKMPMRLREKTFGYINRIKNANRFVKVSMCVSEGDWVDWNKNVSLKYGLYGIVDHDKRRNSYINESRSFIEFPVQPSQNLLLGIKESRCKITHTTTKDFEENIKPLLEYARVLRVIDPYVNTKDWSLNSIEIASRLLGSSLKEEKKYECRFEIYISEGKSALNKKQTRESKELGEIWKPAWEIVKKNGHSLKVVVFGKKEQDQKELHDRFVLTDQCGIMLSTGFSCDQSSRPQVWIMLPEHSYRIVNDMFVSTPSYPVRSQFQFLLS